MESPFINTCKHNTKETNHRICFILIALQFEYFTLKGGSFSLMRRRALTRAGEGRRVNHTGELDVVADLGRGDPEAAGGQVHAT